jgi:hypothetical protein
VLYRTCVHARLLGYEGAIQGISPDRSKLLADLMDATHNLPDLAMRWPNCDESLLRSMLEDFDTRWPASNIGLLSAYDEALAAEPA